MEQGASKKSKGSGKRVIVTQTRSPIGHPKYQGATLRALGLGRIGRSKEHPANDAVMGMVRTVSHLVTIQQG